MLFVFFFSSPDQLPNALYYEKLLRLSSLLLISVDTYVRNDLSDPLQVGWLFLMYPIPYLVLFHPQFKMPG